MVVIIIQPNLTPRYNLGISRQLLHSLVGSLVGQAGFVGMDSEGRIDEFVFFSQTNSTIDILGAVAVPDGNNRSNSGCTSALDHLVTIRVELVAVEMCVRIDEH